MFSQQIELNEYLLQRFIQLINSHAGLQNRAQDRQALCQKLLTRMRANKISQPEAYYQLLEADTEQSKHEWRQLMLVLTTNETYFFRDRGQFEVLRTKILPPLIEGKKKSQRSTGNTKPELRIWSAGCSTGEEPYSLAILIKELIPDWYNWDIYILGTDINLEALEKARQGIFTSWSFRMVDPAIQRQYFQPWKIDWKLDNAIRQMVTLQQGNLVKDIYPSNASSIYNMDLIICRNVFVYFDDRSISVVLQKFAKTLTSVGYLITGHAELCGQELSLFQAKVFPESVVYQGRAAAAGASLAGEANKMELFLTGSVSQVDSPLLKPLPKDNPIVQPKPGLKDFNLINTETTPELLLKEAETLFQRKAYAEALSKAQNLLVLQAPHFGAYYLMAKVYANLGNYHKASYYCEQALSVDYQTVLPYYLLAHIAEEQGDVEKTKVLLKKIIYLAPKSIAAYLEMGSIYEKEGDITRSVKMRMVALDILKTLPPTAKVEQQGLSAGDLTIQVKEMLKNT